VGNPVEVVVEQAEYILYTTWILYSLPEGGLVNLDDGGRRERSVSLYCIEGHGIYRYSIVLESHLYSVMVTVA